MQQPEVRAANFIKDIQIQLNDGGWHHISNEVYSVHGVRSSSLAVLHELKCVDRKAIGNGSRTMVYRRTPTFNNLTVDVFLSAIKRRMQEQKRTENPAPVLFVPPAIPPKPSPIVEEMLGSPTFYLCEVSTNETFKFHSGKVVAQERSYKDCIDKLQVIKQVDKMYGVFKLLGVLQIEMTINDNFLG